MNVDPNCYRVMNFMGYQYRRDVARTADDPADDPADVEENDDDDEGSDGVCCSTMLSDA